MSADDGKGLHPECPDSLKWLNDVCTYLSDQEREGFIRGENYSASLGGVGELTLTSWPLACAEKERHP